LSKKEDKKNEINKLNDEKERKMKNFLIERRKIGKINIFILFISPIFTK
jgi:hypothetical protein